MIGSIRKINSGFTLAELLITISVVAIIASFAIPNFSDTIRQNRLTSNINKLVASNNLARSEAVARGKPVSICKSSNPTAGSPACDTSSDWEDGWIIFVNRDDDSPAAVDAGEEVIRISGPLHTAHSLRGDTPVTSSITYRPNGDTSVSGIFVLCDNSNLSYARAAIVNNNGRIRSTDRNSSGVPLNSAGSAVSSCTP